MSIPWRTFFMWPWLLAPCLILNNSICSFAGEKTNPAKAEPPIHASSTGPTSRQDADIVWKEGREAFDRGDFDTAAFQLQRLVDRYPGERGYLDAHLILGKCRIELKES